MVVWNVEGTYNRMLRKIIFKLDVNERELFRVSTIEAVQNSS